MKANPRSKRSRKLFPKADWDLTKDLQFKAFGLKYGDIMAAIKWKLFNSLLSYIWTPEPDECETTENQFLLLTDYQHCFLNDYSSLIAEDKSKLTSIYI